MNKLRNILNKTIEVICMALLGFMVVLGTWQIITRYLLNNPSTISEDLLIYSFILSVMTEIVILIFSALVLVLGGIQISNLAMGQISPALGIPMGYIYLALPFSGVITIIYNILNLVDLKSSLRRNSLSSTKVIK